ncbi:hypothetical protein GW17_00037854 [Ensete ventricosum]|nr:hypothetical protein GW17_00037854 [Ensete ventricosum]
MVEKHGKEEDREGRKLREELFFPKAGFFWQRSACEWLLTLTSTFGWGSSVRERPQDCDLDSGPVETCSLRTELPSAWQSVIELLSFIRVLCGDTLTTSASAGTWTGTSNLYCGDQFWLHPCSLSISPIG